MDNFGILDFIGNILGYNLFIWNFVPRHSCIQNPAAVSYLTQFQGNLSISGEIEIAGMPPSFEKIII